MPYATISEAKEAGFITTIDGTSLTIEQINWIAKIYDGVKDDPKVDNPMAVAISQFKDAYEKDGNKWVRKEQGENMAAIFDATLFELEWRKNEVIKMADQTERQKNKEAQVARSQKYKIGIKKDTNVTKPSQYDNLSNAQFGDPVNYSYPIDAKHVAAAVTYFSMPKNYGEYTGSERGVVWTRILRASKASGAKHTWNPDLDPLLKDASLKAWAKKPREEQRYKPDYFALSSTTNLAEANGGIIPNQIILHTGEWRDGDVDITKVKINNMIANWEKLKDKETAPYLQPFVKSDHSWSVDDIIGHWENLRGEDREIKTTAGKKIKVYALVGDEVITNPEAFEKIKRGEWTRRSAEFVEKFKDGGTGEQFKDVILGSAYVDIPEITSIPPTEVPIAAAATFEAAVVALRKQLGLENKSENTGGDKVDIEKLKAMLEKMEDGEDKTALAALIEKLEKGEFGDVEELKQKIEELEKVDNKPDEKAVEELVKEALEEKESELVEMRAKLDGKDREDSEAVKRLKAEMKELKIDKMKIELEKPNEKNQTLPKAILDKFEDIALSGGSEGVITLKMEKGTKEKKVDVTHLVAGLLDEVKRLGLVQLGEEKELDEKSKSEEERIKKLAISRGYRKTEEKK